MVWLEPKDHIIDRYFCLCNVAGITTKNKSALKYPTTLNSAIRPIPHSEEAPVPSWPENLCERISNSSIEEDIPRSSVDMDFQPTDKVQASTLYRLS